MERSAPIPYAPSVETVPSDEAADIERAIAALDNILKLREGPQGASTGNVHVKAHGCATAELRVLPNLPPELAQGLFARERTYSAVVRFSNSAPLPQPDYIPDGRGLAIKVFEVDGPTLDAEANGARTQDFILVNHPVFFARDVKDLLQAEQVLAAAKDRNLADVTRAFTSGDWNPRNWQWRQAFTAVQIASHVPKHPASLTYFSMSPFRYGGYVAKFRARPAGELSSSVVDALAKMGATPDALRLMLEETLRSQHLLFELQVQLRTSGDSMPVEDATVEWPESESPYRTVSLLLVPRQEINTPDQKTICEQLSFNVWHALEEHRPLGGINRLRREVYPLAAATRRRTVGTPPTENSTG